MRFTNGRLAAKAVSASLTVALTFGMVPCAWAAEEPANAGNSSENTEETAGHTSNTTSSNTATANEANAGGGSHSQIINEVVVDPTNEEENTNTAENTATEEAAVESEDSAEKSSDDPYASDYVVATLNRTSSYGSMSLISFPDAIEQSCRIALTGWEQSDHVVVLNAADSSNMLSAVSLAGALGCPILLVEGTEASDVFAETLDALGVKQAVTVGKQGAFSQALLNQMAQLPEGAASLSGCTDAQVQMACYNFGLKMNLWKPGKIYVASSAVGLHSLAASVYSAGAPVFTSMPNGHFQEQQREALAQVVANSATTNWQLVALGDESVLSKSSFQEALLAVQSSCVKAKVSRVEIQGDISASMEVAQNLAESGSIGWDGIALSAPGDFVSAVAGAAAQTHAGKALVLIDDENAQGVAEFLADRGIEELLYLGSTLSTSAQSVVEAHLGFAEVIYEKLGSLSAYADPQVDSNASIYGYENVSKTEIMENMDANAISWGDPEFYQFAILSDGYSGAVTAEQLDAWIDMNAGEGSMFKGAGKYFIAAAARYHVNEVYLLAHAALESAWGTSLLATGGIDGYGGAYNFFGVGAYDSNPSYGAVYAAEHGWTTVEAAVMGAAEFISSTYVNGSYGQNTLYTMRWNVKNGAVHQYASSPLWAGSIAKLMNQCYELNDISMGNSGFRFLVPVYE
ncbi:MAG: glucosaminidase domain-containing protein [Coriobacteriia bacterium]|nr:glucosaminidase domain-containing protein [Coriobacteriia bacterium]